VTLGRGQIYGGVQWRSWRGNKYQDQIQYYWNRKGHTSYYYSNLDSVEGLQRLKEFFQTMVNESESNPEIILTSEYE